MCLSEIGDSIFNFIIHPYKSAATVFTGTILGYVPNTIASVITTRGNIDVIFQHTIWTLTALVAITALISFTQKQIDRYKAKKAEREKNTYYFEDDD